MGLFDMMLSDAIRTQQRSQRERAKRKAKNKGVRKAQEAREAAHAANARVWAVPVPPSLEAARIVGGLKRGEDGITPINSIPDQLDAMTWVLQQGWWKPSPETTQRLLSSPAGLSNALQGIE